MLPESKEWLQKAEDDLKVAPLLLGDVDAHYDAVSFHAQQCAEKYLKARLNEAGTAFPKTHSLGALLDLLLPIEPSWNSMRAELDLLSTRAVETRYPGYFADRADAEEALESAARVADVVRSSLGLPPLP